MLRAARRRAGATQREVACRAQVTQPVVAAYESGRRQPTLPMLEKLLAACGAELTLGLRRPRRLPNPEEADADLQLVLDLAEQLPHPPPGELRFPRLPAA